MIVIVQNRRHRLHNAIIRGHTMQRITIQLEIPDSRKQMGIAKDYL
jgi:hypothetical protein